MIFRLLEKRRLHKAISSYVFILGPALVKRYGMSEQYSIKQIAKTIYDLKLNNKYIVYAISLYRHEESENSIDLYKIDQDKLNKIRKIVSKVLFNGDETYRLTDVIKLSKNNQWKGGLHNDWMANKRGQTGF